MSLTQMIQEHVDNFPPDKQAEVLDFVLFLKQRLELAEDKVQEALAVDQQMPFPPTVALQQSGFMGCGQGAEDLSENYKAYLGDYLADKHDYR